MEAGQGVVEGLRILLRQGGPARLGRHPGIALQADGGGCRVLQDVHQVPELLAHVPVKQLGGHDGGTAARMSVKQPPVVEVQALPALRGQRGVKQEAHR